MPRTVRSRRRRRRRRSAGSASVFTLLLVGLVAFCAAVTVPVLSLLSGSPSTLVSTGTAVPTAVLTEASGLLLVAATAVGLGVVLVASRPAGRR